MYVGAHKPAACVKSLKLHEIVGSVSSFPPTPPPPEASLSFQSEKTRAFVPFSVSASAESHPSAVKSRETCSAARGRARVVIPCEPADLLDLVLAAKHLAALGVDEGRIHLGGVRLGRHAPGEADAPPGVDEDEAGFVAAGEAGGLRDATRRSEAARGLSRWMSGGSKRGCHSLATVDRGNVCGQFQIGQRGAQDVENAPVARHARS